MTNNLQGGVSGLLLEICYPTFNREDFCIRNVSNIIRFLDPRFGIYISSNGPASKIQEAFGTIVDVRIHEFSENQGFAANVEHLLNTSKAKYALLMSDEDTINEDELISLLNFLETTGKRDDIYYLPSQSNFSLGSLQQISGRFLNFRDLMLTHPMNPTYMSGYIFPTSRCRGKDIEILFKGGPDNAYPFLKLRNKILKDGCKFMVLPGITLNQGTSANEGDTASVELYSQLSRIKQYQNFTSRDQQYIASKRYLRFVSGVLIANQMQNDMHSKIYFNRIKMKAPSKHIWSITFPKKLGIRYGFRVLASQIIIKIIQKGSGLFRLSKSLGR